MENNTQISSQKEIKMCPTIPIQIPEILHKIQSYLPLSDLLTSTRVSSLWESEARKHLKSRPSSSLCCSTVSQYLDTISPRAQGHTQLRLTTCHNPDCLSALVAKLRESTRLHSVTHLSTHYSLGGNWNQYFQLCSHFCNLTHLQLEPHPSEDLKEARVRLETYLAQNQDQALNSLPSVQTLTWKIPELVALKLSQRENRIFIQFAPILLQYLPNVTTLNLLNVNGHLLYHCFEHLTKITSLSLINTNSMSNVMQEIAMDQVFFLPIHLNRLEFNLFRTENYWGSVLARFSSTLEHVLIRGVKNIPSIESHSFTLTVPILPNLKVFTILWDPSRQTDPCCHYHQHQPEICGLDLKLKFVTATPEARLDYAVQFPSLRRLEVGTDVGPPFDRKPVSEEYVFETCLPFLYDSFLSKPIQELGPCTSLRLLLIPKPPQTLETWKGIRCGETSFLQLTRPSFPWPLETEFYESVATTFPNLENISTYKQIELEENIHQEIGTRRKNMREWLQLGERLGVVMDGFKCGIE